VTGANIPTATPVTIVSIDPVAKTFTLSAAATITGADATEKVIQTPATLSLLSSDTGVQAIAPGSTTGKTTVVGLERGVPGGAGDQYGFAITDVPGITAPDKTGKDDNFRGLTLNPYDNSLYVTKGSGGNGINTVYKVNTPSGALPTLANANTASITILPGFPTELAAASPQFFPFGIWFANATTLYVADEGAPITVKTAADIATAAKDVNAGLEKWSLVNGTWKLDYTLQNGLNLGQDYSASVAKGPNGETYTNPIATAGLRNITGKVNADGTVSIYGVTSTASTATDQGADPNKVVAITDNLAAMTLPTNETFTTIESAKAGEVLRGVSATPSATAVAPPAIVAPSTVFIPPVVPKVNTAFKHVLVISIDGLHNSDLNAASLQSSLTNIKRLQSQGITYSNAFSAAPSDSFPGELNYITGANPGTTGVFYDKSYTDALYAPGTTAAQIAAGTVKPGTTVEFAENVDTTWPTGGTLVGFTDGTKAFDISQLPVDSKGNPVYPNQYLKTNTIFDVATAAGLTTAWSDKHPAAYTILAGPSSDPTKFNLATGKVGSIGDYYSLEINAAVAIDPTKKGPLPTSSFGALVDKSTGTPFSNTNPNILASFFNDATKGNAALSNAPPAGTTAAQFSSYATTSTYDDYKVKAILNEIDGFDHSGTTVNGTPSIYGLNLQAVSVAEKEPGTLFNGGGFDANGNARPDLVNAINHTDQSIGLILDELKKTGQADSTLVILTAKHGQNPVQDPTVGLSSSFNSTDGAVGGDGELTAIGALLARNGIALASERGGDTSSLIYLKNPADVQKAVALLNKKDYSFDTALDKVSDPTGKTTFGTEDALAQGNILYGQALINAGLGDPLTNDRAPDIVVALNTGYFFGNATKKRSEHGGFTDADTHVATIVGSTGLAPSLQGKVEAQTVSTTQIAVTTLQALGLDANQLQGVQLNGTTALPDLTPATLLPFGNKIVAGTTGDDIDTIKPTRNDTIFTDGGNDLVDASVPTASGSNRIYGGDGNDELYAGKNDRLFGENGDDILDASQDKGGNRLYGGAGNDTLFAGTNDFLSGGDGNDTLYAGKGGNTLYGGAGADKFYLLYNGAPASTNTVADFEVGVDSLVLLGVADFSKVTLTAKGADTLVSSGGKDLALITGIQSSALTSSSFKFA
jgi:arylsulfatase A-like enzyme